MSKQQILDAIHELEQLSVLVLVDDDQHLAEAIEEVCPDAD